jgi:hypothetical protein
MPEGTMDASRLDALAKALAGTGSRRAALRLLAGGLLGGLLAGRAPAGVRAACTAHGDPCKRNGQCCSSFCDRHHCRCPQGTISCDATACCGSGTSCVSGSCQADCQAVDRQQTCGDLGCGQKTNNCNQAVDCGDCGSEASCVSGRCEPDCQAEDLLKTCGERGCGEKPNNCGQSVACGDCGSGEVCDGGNCVGSGCQAEDRQTTCGPDGCGTTLNNCNQEVDCGSCPTLCGDGVCNGDETCSSCPDDCGECPPPGTDCTTDADCVARPCCHPTYCVPLAQTPVCDGIACDAGCPPYTMDCGQGHCACQSGHCVAVSDCYDESGTYIC